MFRISFKIVLCLLFYLCTSLNVVFCAVNTQNEVLTSEVVIRRGNVESPFVKGFIEEMPKLTKDLNSTCETQLNELMSAFAKNEKWAIKFIDAWAKFPAGVLYGHFVELGNFDECVDIDQKISQTNNAYNIEGKYCLSEWPMQNAENTSLQLGICIPKACSASEIDLLLKNVIKTDIDVHLPANTVLVKEIDCSVRHQKSAFSAIDWVTVGVLSLLALLMILSTGYDYYMIYLGRGLHPLLSAFSIRTNMRQLFRISKTKPNVIACLNGIRCMSIIWIIYGHCYLYHALSPNINAIALENWIQSPFSMFLQTGTISVDTFFFLSGLLIVTVTFREMEKNSGKLNIPLMYLHRYLRLTPVLALAVLIFMSLYRYTSNGPLWYSLTSSYELCEETWWATLIYVQNYAAAGKMCLGHSWYLAVDTQFYVLAPLVLIAIWKWKRHALAALGIIGLLLFACLFSIIIINKLSFFDTTRNLGGDNAEMRKIYYATHTRASPWIIGIIFGYFLHNRHGRRTTLSPLIVLLGWLVSFALLMTVIFSLYPKAQLSSSPLTPLESAFYIALSRVAWPLALCWIVFACINGYGGPINKFLSCGFWQPLSKLSYCMYIWHLLIISINAARTKTNTYFSDYDVILRFWSDFGLTLIVSVIFYLAIEAPMVGIENFLFPTRRHNNKNDNTNATTQAPTTISQQNLCD